MGTLSTALCLRWAEARTCWAKTGVIELRNLVQRMATSQGLKRGTASDLFFLYGRASVPSTIMFPTVPVVERLALSCRARARREAYAALSADLRPEQRLKLDGLLDSRGETRQTYLGWVRQSLGAANPTNILSCLERLTFLRSLGIRVTWSARLHQNRLVQIAREGANTDVTHLRAFSQDRRYATLVAGVLDAMAVLTDEALEIHERYLGQQFKKAERRHLGKFQENGKAINETLKRYAALGRALIDAKTRNADPFAVVEGFCHGMS